jgi:hypothetical protein
MESVEEEEGRFFSLDSMAEKDFIGSVWINPFK